MISSTLITLLETELEKTADSASSVRDRAFNRPDMFGGKRGSGRAHPDTLKRYGITPHQSNWWQHGQRAFARGRIDEGLKGVSRQANSSKLLSQTRIGRNARLANTAQQVGAFAKRHGGKVALTAGGLALAHGLTKRFSRDDDE